MYGPRSTQCFLIPCLFLFFNFSLFFIFFSWILFYLGGHAGAKIDCEGTEKERDQELWCEKHILLIKNYVKVVWSSYTTLNSYKIKTIPVTRVNLFCSTAWLRFNTECLKLHSKHYICNLSWLATKPVRLWHTFKTPLFNFNNETHTPF